MATDSESLDRISLNIQRSVYYSGKIYVGFQLGVRHFYRTDAVLVPIYLTLRTKSLNKGKLQPFATLGVGYTFDFTNGPDRLGFAFNPSLGLRLNVSKNLNLLYGVSYEIQYYSYNVYNYYNSTSVDGSLSSLSFNFGFEF